MSSYAGLMAPGSIVGYATSKFGVRGFTEALRMELTGSSVKVTLVVPGATRTSLMANSPVVSERDRPRLQKAFDNAPGTTPEKVAHKVVLGIVKGRPRVLTGTDTIALDLITRLAPGRYSSLLATPMRIAMKKTVGA